MKWLVVLGIAAFCTLLLFWRMAFRSASRLPGTGGLAPDFALQDQAGRTRGLGDFRGRWLAFYFFPRADTPG